MAKISILLHTHKFFAIKSSRKAQRECIFYRNTLSPVLLFTHISKIPCCPISIVIVFTLGSLYGTIVIEFVAILES